MRAPTRPYRPAMDDVQRPGERHLLEVPACARITGLLGRDPCNRKLAELLNGDSFVRRNGRRILRRLRWAEVIDLNPARHRASAMIHLCRTLIREGDPVMNMAFHSSELVGGTSPAVRNRTEQERVWAALDQLFAYVSQYLSVEKQTLTEYARQHQEARTV